MTAYTYTAATRGAIVTALEDAAHLLRWESESARRDGVHRHAETLDQAAKRCDAALTALDREDATVVPLHGGAA